MTDATQKQLSIWSGQRGRILIGILTLLLLCVLTAPFFADNIATRAPQPRNGVVSYKLWGPLTQPVELGGDWAFVWEGPEQDTPKTMRIPGLWTGKGHALPPQGRARYELTIEDLPAGRYRLYVPPIWGGNTVSINGQIVGRHGKVGSSAATTEYHVRAHHLSFEQPVAGTAKIAINIAAFLHRDNGLDAMPILGLSDSMELWTAIHWAQEALFYAALALLGIYGLVVFLYRRRDRASLYFACSTLLFLAPSSVLGFDNLLLVAFPSMSFSAMLAWLYLCTEISLGFFLAYANALFPRDGVRPLYRLLMGAIAALVVVQAASFLIAGTLAASLVNRMLFVILVSVFSYLIFVCSRAAIRARDGAIVFLLGMAVFFLSLIALSLVTYGLVPRDQVYGIDFNTYGILVLLFSHIIILAERWSLAISGAERINDDLRQLLDVNLAITSEMQLETLLAKIVRVTSKVLNADRSSLLIHDAEHGDLRSIVAEGVVGEELRLPVETGLAGEVFRTGKPVNVIDAYADPRFNRELDRMTGYKTGSMLSMPVTGRDGRKIGVMQALNRNLPGPFDGEDISRMAAFAAQAAVAIDNATLFREVVSSRNVNESILRSMSSGVMTLDIEGTLIKLNEACCTMMGVTVEEAKSVDWRAFAYANNAWIADEIDHVSKTGAPRTVHDIQVMPVKGAAFSGNVSVVPLMGEAGIEGSLIIIDDISERKRLGGALRRFMPAEVAEQVLERRDELLFGTSCTASVLFADIRNFTSLAETLDPRATVDALNEVFGDLSEAVSEANGIIDKFIGDAVMAVFGAPISSGNDAINAVRCALRMQQMVAAINERRTARGEGALRLGIGIATGDVVAGTIGSLKRMDYTVIGDSVNLAARLEELTKTYPSRIILCEATAAAVKSEFRLGVIDRIQIRGRSQSVSIFSVE